MGSKPDIAKVDGKFYSMRTGRELFVCDKQVLMYTNNGIPIPEASGKEYMIVHDVAFGFSTPERGIIWGTYRGHGEIVDAKLGLTGGWLIPDHVHPSIIQWFPPCPY